MLQIRNLSVGVQGNKILQNLNLSIGKNETHALMGQNGSGKSTLAQTLMGNPQYEVTGGSVLFTGKNLLELSPDERAKEGLFLSFQHPSEIEGVNILSYLRLIHNKKHDEKLSPVAFRKIVFGMLPLLDLKEDFLNRYLNDGFSGGEKKKMEMLQMLILNPKLIILDEVDSGLDVDALRIVSDAVNYMINEKKSSVLIITHYSRILKYVKPDHVHIMKDGQVVKSGKADLAHLIEEKGYSEIL